MIDRQVWNGREYENCNTTGTATDGGYTEAKFNFRVGTDLRKDLQREGAHVVMTRHNNHGVGPCVNKRARIINRSHAAVGIDIHGDGGPPDGRGFASLEPVRDRQNRKVIRISARFGSILRKAVLAGTPMPTSTYDGQMASTTTSPRHSPGQSRASSKRVTTTNREGAGAGCRHARPPELSVACIRGDRRRRMLGGQRGADQSDAAGPGPIDGGTCDQHGC